MVVVITLTDRLTIYIAGDNVMKKSTDAAGRGRPPIPTLVGTNSSWVWAPTFDCHGLQLQHMGNASVSGAIMQNVKSANMGSNQITSLHSTPRCRWFCIL